ncbi:PorP/SprF family type IX secretion system membrane protein [Fluviicola taffensis]|uniref:Putative membrane protein n=1 Tax=Fluviicola taffensis (strain DSM 16823 / NCIMB 13979 / RW262) TaxID=755732 RepID=F2IB02_FLUTR|nr:type IX secretion system membrane protein PorP/SprF [Fluviicola taffensis]AEA45326.1 putative membrane protein [Fluviicola taffensis DSM 16823]
MKTIKFLVACFTLVLLGSTSASAQQDPHYTQYFDNMLFINPAYAGSRGMLNLTGIHREQWVGFDGRPRSSTFSMHSPLSYESVGLGLTAVNDNVGPMNQTMIYADASYTIKFKKHKGKLAFGVKGGINLINIGRDGLNSGNPDDPKLLQNIRNNVNPNFGVGIYYHTPKFFIGISTPKILEKSYDEVSKTNLERRHYFGTIGGVIGLANKWKLRPSSLVKITEGSPLSLDLTLAAIYNEKVWFGANYRLMAAFGAFVQVQLSPQFKVGIASDFGTQKLRNYNDGSFELMVSYDFVFKKEGIRSPRYF